SARIKTLGNPAPPKPDRRTVAPSATSHNASAGLPVRLSIGIAAYASEYPTPTQTWEDKDRHRASANSAHVHPQINIAAGPHLQRPLHVMPGLDPGIHRLAKRRIAGAPGRLRPLRRAMPGNADGKTLRLENAPSPGHSQACEAATKGAPAP